MSSEKFENLAEDLSAVIEKLRPVIESISNLNGEQKKNAVRQAERKLEETNFTVQEMENEAKAAPPQYRTTMLGKLRTMKNDLEHLSKDLKKRKDYGFQSDNFGFDKNEQMEASQKAKLVRGMESLNRTSESLTRTHQIAAETDEIGTEILGDLGRQREVLTRTKDRLTDTDSNLVKSRKILKTMAMRMMTNKMILIVIVLLEIAILGGVVYWKFFSK